MLNILLKRRIGGRVFLITNVRLQSCMSSSQSLVFSRDQEHFISFPRLIGGYR